MQKVVARRNQAHKQPAARQAGGAALEPPQGAQAAQPEAMSERCPQAMKYGQLLAMADSSPALVAQRKLADRIHNSPPMVAQRQFAKDVNSSPRAIAQRQRLESISGSTLQPTMQAKGAPIDDDQPMERKAGVMGYRAAINGPRLTSAISQLAEGCRPVDKRSISSVPTPIQMRIDKTFAQHAGMAPVDQQSVDAYKAYIKDDYLKALNKFKGETPTRRHLINLNIDVAVKYAKAMANLGPWAAVVVALDKLAPVVNECLEFSDFDDGFSNQRGDSWDKAETGLMAMQSVVDAHKIGEMIPKRQKGQQHPKAPKVGWQKTKDALPSAQRDLILQIYLSWKYGHVFDQRSQEERSAKTKNSNTAGALRSWHMNEQAQLPDISQSPLPQNAQQLHGHYEKTSKQPYEGEVEGPIGYAEYTGAGIASDTHYSKIVLDYKSGLIYMTLSHYAPWDKPTEQNPKPVMYGKSAGTGSQSAWFCIDMNA